METDGLRPRCLRCVGASIRRQGAAPLRRVPGVRSVEPLQHRFAYVGSDLQDLYGVRHALSYVRHHLTRAPVVVIARVARTADLYGIGNLVAQDVGEERDRWASWAGIVSWWLLAPIAAIGLTLVPRRDAWVLAMPIAAVLVTSVFFYGTHRIRSPLEPVVVVAAAVAIAHWSRRGERLQPEAVA